MTARPRSSARAALLSSVLLVLVGQVAPAAAAFPGRNGVIAYEHAGDVWVTAPDGSGQRLLVRDAADPAWSPDGTRLAFDRLGGDTWVVDADGSHPVRVGPYYAPAWAPDGRRLAAIDVGGALVVVGADGGGAHTVTSPGGVEPAFGGVLADGPAWSPDGATIAVPTNPFAGRPIIDVWGIAPDGANLRPLLSRDALGVDSQPDWAPDGSGVAVTSTQSHGSGTSIVGADSGQPQALPGEAGVAALRTGAPAHAPDGTALAYESDADAPGGAAGLWVHVLGGANRLVADNATNPSWQPLPSAPDCALVHPDLTTIRPVDHRLHRVQLASEQAGVTVRVTGVRVSEAPRGGRGPDVVREKDKSVVDLRADRNVAGRGRTYLLAFAARGAGGTCAGTAKVVVPGGADWRHPVAPQPTDRWYPAAD